MVSSFRLSKVGNCCERERCWITPYKFNAGSWYSLEAQESARAAAPGTQTLEAEIQEASKTF